MNPRQKQISRIKPKNLPFNKFGAGYSSGKLITCMNLSEFAFIELGKHISSGTRFSVNLLQYGYFKPRRRNVVVYVSCIN